MNKKIISIIAAASLTFGTFASAANKYNEMDYIDTLGFTLGELADIKGFASADEFKKAYELPEDMPEDTNGTVVGNALNVKNSALFLDAEPEVMIDALSTALGREVKEDEMLVDIIRNISIKNYAEIFLGVSYEDFKNAYSLSIDFDENTPCGDIEIQVDRADLEASGMLSYYDRDSILIMLKGKYLDLDVAPIIVNDRTMVPLRSIFEALGAVVNWDTETKTIFATKGDTIIIMQVGQNVMYVNEDKVELDSPSIIVEDRTLVPLRAIANALGNEVGYNDKTKTVIIH